MRKLFAMLLALCMMCSAMTVMAEAPQLQPLQVGPAIFQVNPDQTWETAQQADHAWIGNLTGADYISSVFVFDYEKAELDPDLTTGDDQFDNLFCLMQIAFGVDGDTALNYGNASSNLEDAMLNGDDILYVGLDTLAICTHYYRNIGFIITAISETGAVPAEELCENILNIATTFRLEGVSEEEMLADAAEPDIIGYITITDGANIRTAPDGSATKIKTAYPGETYPLLGEEGTWYKILVDDEVAYVVKGLAKVN